MQHLGLFLGLGVTRPADDVEYVSIILVEAGEKSTALITDESHPATLRFIRFLVSRGRLDQLGGVCAVLEQRICEDAGILKVKITSAHELTDAQLDAMKEKLGTRHGQQIEAEVQVDAALIGGFKIQIGDTIQDFSIATKLEQFEQQVINA